jgi:hypothetical protein
MGLQFIASIVGKCSRVNAFAFTVYMLPSLRYKAFV